MSRALRRVVALIALGTLAFAQTVAAAHACSLRADAIAAAASAADGHACCPDGVESAAVSNPCLAHCSVATNAPVQTPDIPPFGFVPVVATGVDGAAPAYALDRRALRIAPPPAAPPLAISHRLLI